MTDIRNELLSNEELLALTGCARTNDQYKWLRKQGVDCWINRKGHLIAHRDAARLALGARPANDSDQPSTSTESRTHIDQVA